MDAQPHYSKLLAPLERAAHQAFMVEKRSCNLEADLVKAGKGALLFKGQNRASLINADLGQEAVLISPRIGCLMR